MIKPGVEAFFFSFFIPCRGDVAYFDGLIETILAVGLVKPKQGTPRHSQSICHLLFE